MLLVNKNELNVETLLILKMSNTESEMEGYVTEIGDSEDDYIPETEESEAEDVQSDSSDDYEKAVVRIADLIGNVPQDKLNGMVEIVTDFLSGKIEFQDAENDKTFENVMFSLFITGLILLIALLMRMSLGEKTNFINSP